MAASKVRANLNSKQTLVVANVILANVLVLLVIILAGQGVRLI